MSFVLLQTLSYAMHIQILYLDMFIKYFNMFVKIFLFYFATLISKCIINLRKNLRLFILGPS